MPLLQSKSFCKRIQAKQPVEFAGQADWVSYKAISIGCCIRQGKENSRKITRNLGFIRVEYARFSRV
jgi:hypothetical protein